jgi:putative PIN family toxin of toxin-antitoxin system
VVIDTNVLVSALLRPESLPATVLMLTLSGEVRLCVSEAVFAEYDDVIRRPRLNLRLDVIEGVLNSIRTLGHWVAPDFMIEECSDAGDNTFLECAQAAEADFLVTGNRRHFPDQWKTTRMISARELIDVLLA